jgi:glycosyltransferase involved in cell wall biosynthesis
MGGADEFLVDGYNGYAVDTRSDISIMGAIDKFVSLSPQSRMAMRKNALETANRYTIKRAAVSELGLFL